MHTSTLRETKRCQQKMLANADAKLKAIRCAAQQSTGSLLPSLSLHNSPLLLPVPEGQNEKRYLLVKVGHGGLLRRRPNGNSSNRRAANDGRG